MQRRWAFEDAEEWVTDQQVTVLEFHRVGPALAAVVRLTITLNTGESFAAARRIRMIRSKPGARPTAGLS